MRNSNAYFYKNVFGITYQTPISLGNSSNSDEDDD